MIRELLDIWFGPGRGLVLHMPPELIKAVDTLVFVSNERRKVLGSSQGGVDNWELVTREEIIETAVADYVRQHLQVANPRVRRVEPGTGRVQRRI